MSDLLFDKDDVFSWANAEEARQYIGKKGFFSDVGCNNENYWKKAKLIDIRCDDGVSDVFVSSEQIEEYGDEHYTYGLFLPADKVKTAEKVWRPFKDFEEFSKTLNKKIGSEILYRNKKEPLQRIYTMIMGYIENEIYEDQIQIGTATLKFSDYFKQIEIWNGERWQPFGVEE